MDAKQIKKLILSGEIQVWSDLYKYITVRQMFQLFGRSETHWETVRRNPLKLTIGDMETIVQVLKISKKRFLEVVGGED